jgi:hypothetical protein
MKGSAKAVLKGQSLTSAFDMYNGRLQVLKMEIAQTLTRAELGEIPELEATFRMSDIQAEVDGIQECLYVLHALLEEGWYDEDR